MLMILGEDVDIMKKNTGALLQANRKAGLEVNTGRLGYDCS
jgi:hypothetical protein